MTVLTTNSKTVVDCPSTDDKYFFNFMITTTSQLRGLWSDGNTTEEIDLIDIIAPNQDFALGGSCKTRSTLKKGTLTMYREVKQTQELDLGYNEQIPSAPLEDGLDKLTMNLQDMGHLSSRSLKTPISDPEGDLTLPPIGERADKYLKFNKDGDPICVFGETFMGRGEYKTATVYKLNDVITSPDQETVYLAVKTFTSTTFEEDIANDNMRFFMKIEITTTNFVEKAKGAIWENDIEYNEFVEVMEKDTGHIYKSKVGKNLNNALPSKENDYWKRIYIEEDVKGATIGTTLPFYNALTIPKGWFERDGRELTYANYPELFHWVEVNSKFVTKEEWDLDQRGCFCLLTDPKDPIEDAVFLIPDDRGLFERNRDVAGTHFAWEKDLDLGSVEADSFQGHQHTVKILALDGRNKDNYASWNGSGTAYPGTPPIVHTNDPVELGNGTPRVSNETRPYNVKRTLCIKAYEDATTDRNTFKVEWQPTEGLGDVGMISAFPVPSDDGMIPDYYLVCDGSVVLKSDFPSLYVVYGDTFEKEEDPTDIQHFRLPDLKDLALMGFKVGGTDIGRTEEDTMKTHQHMSPLNKFNSNAPFGHTQGSYYSNQGYSTANEVTDLSSHPVTAGSDADIGGTDTKPKNMRVLWCCKYKNTNGGGGVWTSTKEVTDAKYKILSSDRDTLLVYSGAQEGAWSIFTEPSDGDVLWLSNKSDFRLEINKDTGANFTFLFKGDRVARLIYSSMLDEWTEV